MRRTMIVAMLLPLLFGTASLSAQEASAAGEAFKFGLGLGLGVQTFPNPDFPDRDPELLTYQSLSLNPDFAFGKFGIGLGFTVNYRFNGGRDGNDFEVREEDWVVEDFQEFLEVYLAKFRYVRYGTKGEPLYVKLGTVEDATLGNGFIMSNYSNALYLPSRRIFGLTLDIDGKLLDFPYLGMESFIGNLAVLDVIGTRLFIRPLAGSGIPLLDELQVGGTLAADTDPFYFADKDPKFPLDPPDDASVMMFGADLRLPLVSNPAISLAVFSDVVAQNPDDLRYGSMVGFGGRLAGFVLYGAQIRFLGDNFIPSYFGGGYDAFRPEQYYIYKGDIGKKGMVGWFANLGLALFEDKIVFSTTAEGPFGAIEGNYFNWRAVLSVAEGILPGFFFDAGYDKRNMSDIADFLRWQEQSVIQARINYRTGPAVLSFVYNLRYDPIAGDWVVTNGIEAAIALF